MSLYPYQEEGRDFLASHRRAYLADGMGLGKTVQALTAAKKLGLKRILTICPASAVENWYAEAARWLGPTRDYVFAAVSYASRKLTITSGSDWDLVILDESHYVKNHKAKRTIRALTIARDAPRAYLLSGTPMPNHPGELWAPVRALWPEYTEALGLKSHDAWFRYFNYWTLTRFGRRPYGVRNPEDLSRILKKIMIRRQIEDVELDLPPLRIDLHRLPRDHELEKALEGFGIDPATLEVQMEAEDSEEGSASRLRRLLGEYKAPRIAQIIGEELKEHQYHQVVVLAYHRSVLATLREALASYRPVGFDGSTPQKKRQEAINAFTTGGSRVFIAQQTAAGIAINLQTSSEVVLVEPAWTPDENAQAIKRIHRIGQTRPCRARLFAVRGTLDEAIMGTVAQKTRMQTEIGL